MRSNWTRIVLLLVVPAAGCDRIFPYSGAPQGDAALGDDSRDLLGDSDGLDELPAGDLPLSPADVPRADAELPDPVVSTAAGSIEGFADGAATIARFREPIDVAVDDQGKIYVADNGRVLVSTTMDSAGGVSHWEQVLVYSAANTSPATLGSVCGSSNDPPLFNQPGGPAWSGATLYLADMGNHVVRTVTGL